MKDLLRQYHRLESSASHLHPGHEERLAAHEARIHADIAAGLDEEEDKRQTKNAKRRATLLARHGGMKGLRGKPWRVQHER